jgi:processive 1,2-diacylglycerol beta-glucosyltransferase
MYYSCIVKINMYNSCMKILILAVPIGAGHLKAAKAIEQGLHKVASDIDVRSEDCFKWVWPMYGYSYKKIYDFGQKKARGLLKFLYGGLGVGSGASTFLYRAHKILAYRFKLLLDQYKPDYVLSTHFSPGYFAALYKRDYDYKMGIVVTDYYVHPHWVNKEMDQYFIPHESLIDQIMSYGVEKKRVFPYGIPVAIELDKNIDANAARKRFKLSKNRISATVMGSRVFGGEWFELVKRIVDFDYDLSVLCGDNKEVMDKIRQLKGKSNLSTYGMVERIHELIGTTDILITKAGGITTTEASKVGPCLLFANSIVGLEDMNEEFFIGHKAAIRITLDNAGTILAYLLSHPEKIAAVRKNLKAIGKKNAGLNIAKTIVYGTRRI